MENSKKGEGQEQGMPSFTDDIPLQQACSLADRYQQFKGTYFSIFILRMYASVSADCCCPTTRLHFDPIQMAQDIS
jgi:hypothetical protein